MGIAERKEKQKLEIRKMILDASIKLFIEEGYEKVTIRKIADLIEYSPTTVYLYFKDKDEIFFALHDLGFQKLTELNQNLAGIANPLTRLYKMGENYLNFGLQNPEYYDVMFLGREPMKVINGQANCDWHYGDAALAALKQTVEEAMEKGYLIKGNSEAASLAVWGMVHGVVSLAIRERLEKIVTDGDAKSMLFKTLNWFLAALDKTNRE